MPSASAEDYDATFCHTESWELASLPRFRMVWPLSRGRVRAFLTFSEGDGS